MKLQGIHHVALIASDYARSRDFYTRILAWFDRFLQDATAGN